MKVMKKAFRLLLIHLLITTIICMASYVTVFASSNTYDLNKLELKVTIPSGYSVITRDTPASDPIFRELGVTKSAVISQFETSNIYLNAISDTSNEEIVVTMMENSLTNFSLLSDTALNALASTLINQYAEYGIKVLQHEIYQHSQAKFIKLQFTDAANTVYGLQYYTIYDGKAINFTMRSYEGNLKFSQKSNIKTVVDSIEFDNNPPNPDSGEDTNSFIHTDIDSGVIFTVPANWKQKALTKDREFIDIKFVSTKKEGCLIAFGSNDLWEQMSNYDINGYSRADINNSFFTKEDIAEMYGTTADKISIVEYNGTQYYKNVTTGKQEAYGLDFSLTMTQVVHIDNGWMYMFQFSGESSHKLYSDFERLLNSVQYPTISNAPGISVSSKNTSIYNTMSEHSTYSSSNLSDNFDESGNVLSVIVILLIVSALVVAVVAYWKANTQREIQSDCISNNNMMASKSQRMSELSVSCKNCGQVLPLDSEFCHICGTRKKEEELS